MTEETEPPKASIKHLCGTLGGYVQRDVAQDTVSAGARVRKTCWVAAKAVSRTIPRPGTHLSVGGAVSSVLAFSDTNLTASEHDRRTG